jgi:hypothetical protein
MGTIRVAKSQPSPGSQPLIVRTPTRPAAIELEDAMTEPRPHVWTILLEHDGKAVSLAVDTEGASLNTDRLLMLREAINGMYWQWWYEHGGPKET